jgi:alpha-maltose-1-phosphate synthase
MRVAMLSREFPPDVYGGAGVHVDFLSRELRRLVDLDVHCWGPTREDATGHLADPGLEGANAALTTLSIDLRMAAAIEGCDLVHSHTWYANMGGHLARLLHGVPHVVSAHSLEPLRPWKAEQLGGGYAISSWVERTAYEAADAVIAVSHGMRHDIVAAYPEIDPARVHVVHNGIDTELYQPAGDTDVVERVGLDPSRPYVVFVGRITHQKGVRHLLAAAHDFVPEVQVLLCAGAPDTEEIGAETARAVAELQQQRDGVVWVDAMLPREEVVQLLTHATVFVCPSVYEPLGIVNLEAMACGTAVVASAVGGIPEVVDDGITGFLVPYEPHREHEFERALAARVNDVVSTPGLAGRMGRAGRERAIEEFSWAAIAEQTVGIYKSLLA